MCVHWLYATMLLPMLWHQQGVRLLYSRIMQHPPRLQRSMPDARASL